MESTKHFFLHFTGTNLLLVNLLNKIKGKRIYENNYSLITQLFFLGTKNFAQQKQKSIPEATFQYIISSRIFDSVFF